MKTNQDLSDPLSSQPVGKLFARFALPLAMGMLINSLYNIIDVFFISRYTGPLGVAAVSAVFPLQIALFALAAMFSNGVSILISRSLGARQPDKVGHLLKTGIVIVITASVIIAALGFGLRSSLFNLLSITAPITGYAQEYYVPLIASSGLLFISAMCNDLLRAFSQVQMLFLTIVVGAVSNIILDALFIAVFEWGVTGAALATLSSMLIAVLFALRGLTLSSHWQKALVHWRSWRMMPVSQIIALGLPVLISYAGAALIMSSINHFIVTYSGDDAAITLAAYGILNRINLLMVLPLIAVTSATQTLVAFNAGAQLHKRVRQVKVVSLTSATVYLLIMTGILLSSAGPVMTIFSDDLAVIRMGTSIANTVFLMLPLAGITAVSVGIFQGLGHVRHALIASTAKIYLFILPLLFLLPWSEFDRGFWLVFPISDVLAFILCFCLLLWRGHNPESGILQKGQYS